MQWYTKYTPSFTRLHRRAHTRMDAHNTCKSTHENIQVEKMQMSKECRCKLIHLIHVANWCTAQSCVSYDVSNEFNNLSPLTASGCTLQILCPPMPESQPFNYLGTQGGQQEAKNLQCPCWHRRAWGSPPLVTGWYSHVLAVNGPRGKHIIISQCIKMGT